LNIPKNNKIKKLKYKYENHNHDKENGDEDNNQGNSSKNACSGNISGVCGMSHNPDLIMTLM